MKYVVYRIVPQGFRFLTGSGRYREHFQDDVQKARLFSGASQASAFANAYKCFYKEVRVVF